MDMKDGDEEMSSKRVQVRYITKLGSPYKVPAVAVAIPTNLTRLGLSTIINDLLKSSDFDWKPIPFDFLIDAELVRMPLEQFLLAKGITAEKVLDIEYIKAVVPRKQDNPILHDDWVSAVCGDDPRFIMTGCYDKFGRLWRADGSCTHILEGHKDAVTSICIVNPKAAVESKTSVHIATASKDKTLRLWKFDVEENLSDPRKITSYKVLKGHTASVQSVVANPSGDMVCSGSWDSTINLWRTSGSDAEGDLASVKKRKVGTGAKELQLEGEAVTMFAGHKQCVSSVVWLEYDTIYSASWDHSIRRWDIETGKIR